MRPIVIASVLLLGLFAPASAQQAAGAVPIEKRLEAFAVRLRVCLSMAAVAAYSPTVADAHGQADRLAVLLRGDPRAEVIGMLSEAASLSEWIVAHSLSPESKRPLLAAAANVHAYVRLAHDSVTDARRDRTLVGTTQSLLRAYAFLAAAWAQPIGGIGVPGLDAVLRAFGVLDPSS